MPNIDWSSPVFCSNCGEECKRRIRPSTQEFLYDPRRTYEANGYCAFCYKRLRSIASGKFKGVFVDWSKEQHCSRCNREMRIGTSAPDGRQPYAGKGICALCARRDRDVARGIQPQKYVKFDSTHQECSGCSRWLELRNFSKTYRRTTRSGLRSICNKCTDLSTRFGMTYEQFLAFRIEWGHSCGSCGASEDDCPLGLVIDHDHSCCGGPKACSQCIRGLLCSSCNTSLGGLRDNLGYIDTAISYLTRPKPKSVFTLNPKKFGYSVDNLWTHCGYCDLDLPKTEFYGGQTRCKRCIVYRNHNISKEIYYDLLNTQQFACAICQDTHSETHRGWLQIDHDHSCCPGPHSCGACVRGLLCGKCNAGIGILGDSVERLGFLRDYLTKYDKKTRRMRSETLV